MIRFLYFFFVAAFVSSCSPYQKALKSDDVAVKYAEAEKKFEAKKYSKAIRLFEQLAPAFRGKPQSEKMFYMFAQSYYLTEQYYLGAYQFESFVASYPKSEKIEETSYLVGKCYSMMSPPYSLDQTETIKGIDKLQIFIDAYPNSSYLAEANTTLKGLTGKIEKKYFEIAKQYNTISDHKAALVALDNFIDEYPGTIHKEDALYYRFDSAYKLAINSVPAKMEERLKNAKTAYTNLVKFKSDSGYKIKADEMLVKIDQELKQFSK